jgi:hypothetical protein
MSVKDIPADLIKFIFGFLTFQELNYFSQTDKWFNKMCKKIPFFINEVISEKKYIQYSKHWNMKGVIIFNRGGNLLKYI